VSDFVGEKSAYFLLVKNFFGPKRREKTGIWKKEADFVRIKLFTPNSKKNFDFSSRIKKVTF